MVCESREAPLLIEHSGHVLARGTFYAALAGVGTEHREFAARGRYQPVGKGAQDHRADHVLQAENLADDVDEAHSLITRLLGGHGLTPRPQRVPTGATFGVVVRCVERRWLPAAEVDNQPPRAGDSAAVRWVAPV